ncbi:hypothetical protein [Oscillatoria acuminata]|uniref:Uncharacterized protein n=1 Tax=Oscillatoria acuminata PCC 6304 TaxID=56110 RepID=K9TPZ3_9CYAN|nr:hypothetical protein [Oscillatoria acuminata]AFY84079.1 hypothetical protein Oscil6304_4565 [Oscillatoria acuminata PCC 6304]
MKPKWLFFLAILTLFFLGVREVTPVQKDPIPPATVTTETPRIDFPLIPGSYWVYEGMTQWMSPNSGQINQTPITWKMEVVDRFERGPLKIAILKGFPADVAWYSQGKERGNHLIIEVSPGKFYLVSDERARLVLQRLTDEADVLVNLLEDLELLLDLPLIPGKVFGPSEQITRLDGGYRWNVETSEQVGLEVPGISSRESHIQYHLTFRTAPDMMNIYFVPGIGITRYQYQHHGAIAETDLKLIEYYPGH